MEICSGRFVWDSQSLLYAAGNSVLRELTELNTEGADAYPYLSPDGLRLCFSQGPNSRFYVASRETTSDNFSNQRQLSNISGIAVGCWLTNDELEIFWTSDNALHYASRPSIDSDFSESTAVELTGDLDGFISGPSLTPNLNELYLNYAGFDDTIVILIFEREQNLSYSQKGYMELPVNSSPTPGQLSKDGLHYYLGLTDLNTEVTSLYRFERAAIGEAFSPASQRKRCQPPSLVT